MSQMSSFEILGPIMIGPSSSHTAGALRIAKLARSLIFGEVSHVHFILYNSFARTHAGHGTDKALLAGILDLNTDDYDIKHAFELANKSGLSYEFEYSEEGDGLHPNTVDIIMDTPDGNRLQIRGESRGGGRIVVSQINGIEVSLSGEFNTLFIVHRDTPGVLAKVSTTIANFGINVAFMRSYRENKGGMACTIFETDEPICQEAIDEVLEIEAVSTASAVVVPGAITNPGATVDHDFISGTELLELCSKEDKSIGQIMFERECELVGKELSVAKMYEVLSIFKEETHIPIEHPERSLGGLIGGEARKVFYAPEKVLKLVGELRIKSSAYAMAVLERSATMGLIVASPTAGASGVVPGVLIAAQEEMGFSDEEMFDALYTSCAVGYLLARNASVSGAEGGCQAETGSASAMAAASLCQLMGGGPEVCLHAASLAIANALGLVCDPICGLVEAPCQVRNAAMAANAITAATLALSDVKAVVPFDESVEVMKKVGAALPKSLRETAEGGLAQAPSALKHCATCGICAL